MTPAASLEHLHHELRLAHRVQQCLLPANHPVLHNFDLLAWNQPAERTGGDYYDWFPMPGGKLAIVMADATGHGVSAALSIVAFRAYVRAVFAQDLGFAAQLSCINNFLVEDLIDGRFVTALLGVLDPLRRTISLHSAGQGPLFYYRAATGELEQWPADSMPLGVMRMAAPPPVRELEFARGDTFITLTDGFYEWPNAVGTGPGIAGLAQLIAHHHALPLHDLIATLHGEVLEQVDNAEQHDDLTALALCCTA